MPENGRKNVLSASREKYGDHYSDHLLEQYKLFVESADHISARRTSANNYLLTVNAFLVTIYGLASSLGSNLAWQFFVPVSGVLVCITWTVLIRSYRDLNTAKFKVIHELEVYLPAALFDREWELAERGEGKAYRQLTRIEPYIPLVFGALYVVLAGFALFASPTNPDSTDSPPEASGELEPVAFLEDITIQRSPTPQWIEVYHDGELTSEWHPSDGAVYEVLETLLNDDLGPWPAVNQPTLHVASLL